MEAAAFFDLDRTVIAVNSARLWLRQMWRDGELGTTDLIRSMGYLVGYKLALVDVEGLTRRAVERLEGLDEETMRRRVHRWYEREVRRHIVPQMVEMIEDHRRRGHPIVLLTTSSPYVSECVASELDLDDILCTRFEVGEDGQFTGRLDGPVCYGKGKVHRSERWAREHGVCLGRSYFYSDSYTDRPMLERVAHGVAVNPDPRLALWARRRGVPVRRFE